MQAKQIQTTILVATMIFYLGVEYRFEYLHYFFILKVQTVTSNDNYYLFIQTHTPILINVHIVHQYWPIHKINN